MHFKHLRLQNWRNFRDVDVPLHERMFLVGPNASGKSNLLDAFRFLRDVAEPRGGLAEAVQSRGGVSRLRSLHARQRPDVAVDVTLDIAGESWRYDLAFGQDSQRNPVVKRERVWRGTELIVDRPGGVEEDRDDPRRLGQTYLEQINANRSFREVADFLAELRYLHIVPQLIREPDRYTRANGASDPHGGDFLERLARAQKEQRRTFESRMRRINEALRVAVPELVELRLERDETGRPHLQGRYEHWRQGAGWQGEDQLSDGTLRLLGLFWSLLDGNGPLLLEEPELSLHESLIRHLPDMMWRAMRKRSRQVIISTHSSALLSDRSIAGEEVLMLVPGHGGTSVMVAGDLAEVRALLDSGLTVGEAVLPRVAPPHPEQLLLKFPD